MSLEIDHALHNLAKKERLSDEALHQFFSQLKPEDIEQFFMAYQLWSQRQQLTNIELQIRELQPA